MSDSAPYHMGDGGRRDRGSGSEAERSHHHHRHRHRTSEGDARSDGSASRYRHSKVTSDDADSEMVPALDVIRSRVAVARVKEGSGGKHRHHRQHRHSHLGYQSSESGYSAMSAPPAPKGSQVLLELGPDSASPTKHGPGGTPTGPGSTTGSNNNHPLPRRPSFGQEQQGMFSSRTAPLPRDGSPDGQYVKVEYPNGVIIHDTRNQGRIPNHVMYQAALQLNGVSRNHHNSSVKNSATDYIDVVSGPTKRGDSPPYYYSSPSHMMPSSKSTVL
ncbi:ras/Rap GTPase-activating protein SynGAP-like [Stylophora pistillata]|uniref:ras/Rap GTPase-activating protein SynGAP-like n=1 Tax=Stylophora pistillata TaxID=50429 RepID=UPI000C04EB22|nr:ras/Rap GTPase-activating protein SynGAP-like [Stylophora pistillata]